MHLWQFCTAFRVETSLFMKTGMDKFKTGTCWDAILNLANIWGHFWKSTSLDQQAWIICTFAIWFLIQAQQPFQNIATVEWWGQMLTEGCYLLWFQLCNVLTSQSYEGSDSPISFITTILTLILHRYFAGILIFKKSSLKAVPLAAHGWPQQLLETFIPCRRSSPLQHSCTGV